MAGRLSHPHIVTIFDAGEDRGIAYIAMELLRGRHLVEYTDASRLLPTHEALEIVARLADALHYAHLCRVVHRDIKPANVMYDPQSAELKITDFGIARLTDTSRTRTGVVLGTPSFMSPEQLAGRVVTGSSDLFSLAITAFQLLTGQLPFRGDSMPALMLRIAHEPNPRIRNIRPDLPAGLDEVFDRALAKQPADRIASGAAFACALRDVNAASGPERAAQGQVPLRRHERHWPHPRAQRGYDRDRRRHRPRGAGRRHGRIQGRRGRKRIAVRTVMSLVKEAVEREDLSLRDPATGMSRSGILLRDAIQRANKIIYQTAKTQANCEGMGTTVVAGIFFDDKLTVAHVGDSRLYCLRGSEFRQVTQDHSCCRNWSRAASTRPRRRTGRRRRTT